MAGITVNPIKGKLIKSQNLVLDRIAFVLSQKNIPLKVKLISPFLFIVIIWRHSWMMKTKIPIIMRVKILIWVKSVSKKKVLEKWWAEVDIQTSYNVYDTNYFVWTESNLKNSYLFVVSAETNKL